MKVAYLMLAHHKPRQFARVFAALYNPVDLFLVHVDRKATAQTHGAIAEVLAGRANVHCLRSRPLCWGGWSISAIHLEAIRVLLALDVEWRYFANLSGQDYPLKPADAIRAELAVQPDRNHVEAATIESFARADRNDLYRRMRSLHIEVAGRVIDTRFPIPRWGKVRLEWKGSAWVTLTRDFCEWIDRDPFARQCIRALRYTYIADEFLMQTLGMNGPFAETLTGDNRREILWVGGSHPVTLTMQHSDRLLHSPAHFARKFDEDVDARILDVLARRIGVAPTS
ncbi:MAG: beta-1,6-N-acetylglucosaminyltransferase [Betaproteobacteria bacterium]